MAERAVRLHAMAYGRHSYPNPPVLLEALLGAERWANRHRRVGGGAEIGAPVRPRG